MRWPWASRKRLDSTIGMWRLNIRQWMSVVRPMVTQFQQLIERVNDCVDHAAGKTTPTMAAGIFSKWDSGQQAQFFNEVGELTSKWKRTRRSQFACIGEDLDDDGRSLLQELVQYSVGGGSAE